MVTNFFVGVGNLGKDPVIRQTQSGTAVAGFSIGCNRSYTDRQGQQKEITDWINVVAWGELANQVGQHLQKGRRVVVIGRQGTRSYDQNGQKHYITEVTADVIAPALPSTTPRSGGYQQGGYNNGGQQGGYSNGGGYGGQQNRQQQNYGNQQQGNGGWGNQQNGQQAPQQSNGGFERFGQGGGQQQNGWGNGAGDEDIPF